MNIYDIKHCHEEAFPSSKFFSRENMKHAGQTLKKFRVYKIDETHFRIVAPRTRPANVGFGRVLCGYTERIYNTVTKDLEIPCSN